MNNEMRPIWSHFIFYELLGRNSTFDELNESVLSAHTAGSPLSLHLYFHDSARRTTS